MCLVTDSKEYVWVLSALQPITTYGFTPVRMIGAPDALEHKTIHSSHPKVRAKVFVLLSVATLRTVGNMSYSISVPREIPGLLSGVRYTFTGTGTDFYKWYSALEAVLSKL